MDFYIIEEENIQNFTPLMEQSYGHDNIYIRMSNDGTLGLMNFTLIISSMSKSCKTISIQVYS